MLQKEVQLSITSFVHNLVVSSGSNKPTLLVSIQRNSFNLQYLLQYIHDVVICEKNGVTCSNRGSCGPGSIGCVCDSSDIHGEYCELVDESTPISNSAHLTKGNVASTVMQLITSFALFQLMYM